MVRSAAELFCGVVPMAVFSRWGRALRLDASGASGCGLLLQRLGGVGLGWAPSLGSACALLAYVMCVSLNVQVTGAWRGAGASISGIKRRAHDGLREGRSDSPWLTRAFGPHALAGGTPEALFLAAPLLLLLQQDPLVAPGLTPARRYTIPFIATCASLLVCSATDALAPALAHAGAALGFSAERAGMGVHGGLYSARSAAAARPLLPLLGSESVAVLAAQQVRGGALHCQREQERRPGVQEGPRGAPGGGGGWVAATVRRATVLQVAVAAACLPAALLVTWGMWANKPLSVLTQV